MIGKLTGCLDSVGRESLILDVGGVGYHVYAPASVLAGLPPPGACISLFIETFVREDQIRLFGFISPYQHDWFCLLIRIQGVGTKMALSILSAATTERLLDAVAAGDTAPFMRASGVGKKTAQRLVTELKDKVALLMPKICTRAQDDARMPPESVTLPPKTPGQKSATGDVRASEQSSAQERMFQDAMLALVGLGYERTEVFVALRAALCTGDEKMTSENLVRRALKELSR